MSTVHYNLGAIKSSLSQFFAGWMTAMATHNPTEAEIAQEIYENTVKQFNLDIKEEK